MDRGEKRCLILMVFMTWLLLLQYKSYGVIHGVILIISKHSLFYRGLKVNHDDYTIKLGALMLCGLAKKIGLRSSLDTTHLVIPRSRRLNDDRSYSVCGPKLWNDIPHHRRIFSTVSTFKRNLKLVLNVFLFVCNLGSYFCICCSFFL